MTNDDYNRRRVEPQQRNLADLFFRLGCDINDPDEIRSLAEDLRWIREKREAAEKRWAFRNRTVLAIIGAVIGPPLTVAIQWFVNRYNGGGH